ncbi:MAG: signal recognition particle-docking protein FtsY [Oscillospiraceae bacterium]|nr:signal recognition particle-docking protein FtsY [Oscillospiraceae bacterium]
MGLFDKIFSGLTKTRNNMAELEELFQGYQPDDEDFYEGIEDMLIMSDAGAAMAEEVVTAMRKMTWERRFRKGSEARDGLIEILTKTLSVEDVSLKLATKPAVILMVGVNGVGKTTTIGKLAHQFAEGGKKVLLCAGDTFRAAAAEQLNIWAERSGTDLVKHEEGSDPAAVVFDALNAAKARGSDIVIIDTAGRLHNKANLMNELGKIRRIIDRELPDADVETLLVLDATTGQNGLIQAKEFKNTAGLTGIVLTKLDGTAKGGIVFPIAKELGVPVKFVGVGEGIDDLIPFDAKNYVEALFK